MQHITEVERGSVPPSIFCNIGTQELLILSDTTTVGNSLE